MVYELRVTDIDKFVARQIAKVCMMSLAFFNRVKLSGILGRLGDPTSALQVTQAYCRIPEKGGSSTSRKTTSEYNCQSQSHPLRRSVFWQNRM